MEDGTQKSKNLVTVAPFGVEKIIPLKKGKTTNLPFDISTKEGLMIRIIECGFDPRDSLTLEEIGIVLGGVTRERVRQIEVSALRKLKHPKIGRLLRKYVGDDTGFKKLKEAALSNKE